MANRATMHRVGKHRDRDAPETAPGVRRGRIRVGTASWTDPGFIADWYPEDLPARERLRWYAGHFDLVEVNSSFYSLPGVKTSAGWNKQTPADFVFDVKLHRLRSRHSTPPKLLPRDFRPLAKLHENRVQLTPRLEAAMAKRFLEGVEPLREAGKLGALLLQLSPSFSPRSHSLDELDDLIELTRGYRLAVELRHREWLIGDQEAETIAYFKKRRVTLVSVDGPRSEHFMVLPAVDAVTNPRLAYLRAHGRNARGYISGRTVADRFDYDYSPKELREIADRAVDLAEVAGATHIIFNNNKSSYAPKAAERFRRIVQPSQRPSRVNT